MEQPPTARLGSILALARALVQSAQWRGLNLWILSPLAIYNVTKTLNSRTD